MTDIHDWNLLIHWNFEFMYMITLKRQAVYCYPSKVGFQCVCGCSRMWVLKLPDYIILIELKILQINRRKNLNQVIPLNLLCWNNCLTNCWDLLCIYATWDIDKVGTTEFYVIALLGTPLNIFEVKSESIIERLMSFMSHPKYTSVFLCQRLHENIAEPTCMSKISSAIFQLSCTFVAQYDTRKQPSPCTNERHDVCTLPGTIHGSQHLQLCGPNHLNWLESPERSSTKRFLWRKR